MNENRSQAKSGSEGAGTDPTDSNSLFRVDIDGLMAEFQTEETTPQHGGLERWYSLKSRTNLIGGADWAGVSGYTNIMGNKGRTCSTLTVCPVTPAFSVSVPCLAGVERRAEEVYTR